MAEIYVAPMELKFVASDIPGEVEGYGAVFGNRDSHGDVIMPGAFGAVLAEHKARGTMPTLYVEHGPALGGSMLPDGVWTEMAEDDRGLRLKGRISALDTDHGRRIRALVQDGALHGMSIGFKVGPGNAVFGKKSDEPRRSIKSFEALYEVSLVTSPSNTLAKIESIKSVMALADRDRAVNGARAALMLHTASLNGGDSPTADERTELLTHLQDVHEALTGARMPADVKVTPTTIREMEVALREIGFSRSMAADIATRGFKAATNPRDEGAEQAALRAGLVADLGDLSGFSLPKF